MAFNSFLKIPWVSSVTRLVPWVILSTFEGSGSNLIVIVPPLLLNPLTSSSSESSLLFNCNLGLIADFQTIP